MRNPATVATRSSILIFSLMLACVVSALVWGARAHAYADGQLDISDPGPLTDKQKVTVTDPGNKDRKFEKGKFKVAPQPAGIVSIKNPPAADDGVFEITPVKVGKATLTIEYKVDDNTVLKGTRDVFVVYKNVEIVNLGDQPLKLLAPQSKSFAVSAVDFNGATTKVTRVDSVESDNEGAATGDFDGQQLNVHAKAAGKATLTLKLFGQKLASLDVEVAEGVARIEIDNAGAVTTGDVQIAIPEGESKQLKVKIIGVNGTEFKPADVQLKTTVAPASDSCGALQVTYDDKDPKLLNIAAPLLTTMNGCSSRTVTLTIAGKKVKDDSTLDDLTTDIKISITQKIGFIRLTPSSLFLGQNGRMKITADVFGSTNVLVAPPPDVTFNLADEKDSVWVSLAKEGNTATLLSRNPSQKEIRDKNDNELVPRPSAVVVVAKTRLNPTSPQIDSSISISLGEVVGFDLLKVKLNLMDERTAADLYGKVTSDEYYVLTVRLFNNLKNERTGLVDGNSILAYSSSIEVAVGLEKRFDAGTDSYFPYVIKESEAKKMAKENATQASALLTQRFKTEADSLKAAQTELNKALGELYQARQEALSKMSEALKKKVRAQDLTATARGFTDPKLRIPAFADANVAIDEYNRAWAEADAALKKANGLDEQVVNLRRTFARKTAELAPIRQDLARLTDPDTAIDDGLWHPLTPADLNRLNPVPAPSPTDADSVVDAGPLPRLTDADSKSRSTRGLHATAANSEPPPIPRDPDDDPPCVGVITYRPFTFEMMVNTVDRRDSRSVRSKVFRVLDFIGTGTSFVTSVAVPGPGSDLPLGLEKYRNLLLPGLDKIWPNYKEQQRQNIVSQAMKEIEEIPFGSDITRVIFIPKRTIHGLVRGHDARISEVCPYFFRVQVAIVSKNAQVEQGTIRQPQQ